MDTHQDNLDQVEFDVVTASQAIMDTRVSRKDVDQLLDDGKEEIGEASEVMRNVFAVQAFLDQRNQYLIDHIDEFSAFVEPRIEKMDDLGEQRHHEKRLRKLNEAVRPKVVKINNDGQVKTVNEKLLDYLTHKTRRAFVMTHYKDVCNRKTFRAYEKAYANIYCYLESICKRIAFKYASNRFQIDELTSVGMERALRCIEITQAKDEGVFVAYVKRSVQGSILRNLVDVSKAPVSLDRPFSSDDGRSLYDVTSDPSSVNPEQELSARQEAELDEPALSSCRREVEKILFFFPVNDRKIIKMMMEGVDDFEIAAKFGHTQRLIKQRRDILTKKISEFLSNAHHPEQIEYNRLLTILTPDEDGKMTHLGALRLIDELGITLDHWDVECACAVAQSTFNFTAARRRTFEVTYLSESGQYFDRHEVSEVIGVNQRSILEYNNFCLSKIRELPIIAERRSLTAIEITNVLTPNEEGLCTSNIKTLATFLKIPPEDWDTECAQFAGQCVMSFNATQRRVFKYAFLSGSNQSPLCREIEEEFGLNPGAGSFYLYKIYECLSDCSSIKDKANAFPKMLTPDSEGQITHAGVMVLMRKLGISKEDWDQELINTIVSYLLELPIKKRIVFRKFALNSDEKVHSIKNISEELGLREATASAMVNEVLEKISQLDVVIEIESREKRRVFDLLKSASEGKKDHPGVIAFIRMLRIRPEDLGLLSIQFLVNALFEMKPEQRLNVQMVYFNHEPAYFTYQKVAQRFALTRSYVYLHVHEAMNLLSSLEIISSRRAAEKRRVFDLLTPDEMGVIRNPRTAALLRRLGIDPSNCDEELVGSMVSSLGQLSPECEYALRAVHFSDLDPQFNLKKIGEEIGLKKSMVSKHVVNAVKLFSDLPLVQERLAA